MWENEERKRIIWNIVISVALVLVAAGLLFAVIQAKKQIEAEDAQLSAERSNQVQVLNDTRQENLAAVQQAYEADMETVAQYLPGIVCWGDSLTAGSSGNVSFPRPCKSTSMPTCATYMTCAIPLTIRKPIPG